MILRQNFEHRSADQFIVVGVQADPEPEVAAVSVNGECAIAQTDVDRSVTSDSRKEHRPHRGYASVSGNATPGRYSDTGRIS
jgi:hypothetical protein